jgi:hypothetical protein
LGGGGGGLASALAEPNLKTLRDEKRDGLDGAEDESGRNEDEPDGGGLRLELIMCLEMIRDGRRLRRWTGC